KNGMELDAEMGPIVTKAALERITGYIDSGVASGAKLLVDGRGLKVAGHDQYSLACVWRTLPKRSI
ncbi:MAG: hypothetical protein RLY75_1574, partial [Pseudomonadota bacterium]